MSYYAKAVRKPTFTLLWGMIMKQTYSKSLLILAIWLTTLLVGSAHAQIKQSDLIFEGSVSFASMSGDLHGDHSTTVFSLQPRMYYFLADHMALGGRLGLTSTSGGGSSTTEFLLGPDFDYYFQTESKDIYPFAGGGLFYSSVSDGKSTSGFTFGLHGGLAYLLKPHLALKPGLEIDFESRDSHAGTTIMLGMGLAGFLY
jgi:hypothetical protein